MGESAFLSRRHIDWSRTRAYAQGNFGQIFLNLKGRQPQGAVEPKDARALLDELKAALLKIPHPQTGEPLVERVYESQELYDGPVAHLAPDLTVVLKDWAYRTIGLHDFTTNRLVSPAFGPTGDHRIEGILIASGASIQSGPLPADANLLDITPTILQLLGIPIPADLDGRCSTLCSSQRPERVPIRNPGIPASREDARSQSPMPRSRSRLVTTPVIATRRTRPSSSGSKISDIFDRMDCTRQPADLR